MGAGATLKQNNTGSVHFGKSRKVAEDETLTQYLLVTKLPIESDHAFYTRESSIAVGSYTQDEIQCRQINLNPLKSQYDPYFENVKFSAVPNSSYRLISKRMAGSTRMSYIQNALQVTVVNVSIMYNLDSKDAKWVLDDTTVDNSEALFDKNDI